MLAAVATALSACARGEPFAVSGAVAPVAGTELPAPGTRDVTAEGRNNVLGPFDTVRVGVFGVEGLQEREYRIDGSGQLSFPLAGTIIVSGRTTAEVSDLIADRLRESGIRRPEVSVNLAENRSQVVTVSGSVRAPGNYPVLGNMSLMRAVAAASGVAENANSREVVLFRTVDGRKMAALYDLRGIQRGNYPDPEVYPNDVIVVDDSDSRRLFRDALQLFPLLTTPLIVLLQN